MKGTFVLHDKVADVINETVTSFDEGDIQNIVVFYIDKEGASRTLWGNANWHLRRGMLEDALDQMKRTYEE